MKDLHGRNTNKYTRTLLPLGTLLLFLLAGCAQASSTASTTTTSTPGSSGQTATPSTTSLTGLQKPAIPTTGAYIGAWVNPSGIRKSDQADSGQTDQEAGTKEITQLPAFNQAIGTHVEILHLYTAFTSPLPVQTMNSIEQNGSIPMVDWACGNVGKINSGSYDTLITTYAQAMKSFAKPVFLRWYWEMNLNDQSHNSCGVGKDAASFVTAWRHIWTIFQNVGTRNVAFVWCPSGDNDAASFYPGDQYVDWIAIDHYDIPSRNGAGAEAVTSLFDSFYKEWSGHNKPMMISETAATPGNQVVYLQALQSAFMSQYPDFKALMYFDSTGKSDIKGPWNLQNAGFTAFGALAKSSYFSFGRNS